MLGEEAFAVVFIVLVMHVLWKIPGGYRVCVLISGSALDGFLFLARQPCSRFRE